MEHNRFRNSSSPSPKHESVLNFTTKYEATRPETPGNTPLNIKSEPADENKSSATATTRETSATLASYCRASPVKTTSVDFANRTRPKTPENKELTQEYKHFLVRLNTLGFLSEEVLVLALIYF
jgi:hypothetical protein